MRFPVCIAACAGVCLALALAPPSHADDSVATQIATAITKSAAVKILKEGKYEFDEPEFKGEAQAVEPEKHVKVSIKKLELFPLHVTLTIAMEAPFAIRGKLKTEDEAVAVKGEAIITHVVSVYADFQVIDDRIEVQPRVTKLELKAKITEVEPSDLDGGKDRLEKTADAVMKRNADKIMRETNDWLRAHRIGSE